VNFIFDADVASFFDSVSQNWLVRSWSTASATSASSALSGKWLKAGVLEDGLTVGEIGTGQGSVISPLLANIYMHYVFDLWANRWRQHEAQGDMVIVRYADDFVVGFEHEADARRFWDALRARLEEFALTLHPDKTRLIEFGRHATDPTRQGGAWKTETFKFLGFVFICGKTRRGKFLVHRRSRRDRIADEAHGDSRRSCASACISRYRARTLAGAGRQGLLCLSCRAYQRTENQRFPLPCGQVLAAHAPASKPERSLHVGADQATGQRLASAASHPSPLAKCAFCRQILE